MDCGFQVEVVMCEGLARRRDYARISGFGSLRAGRPTAVDSGTRRPYNHISGGEQSSSYRRHITFTTTLHEPKIT